MKHGFFTVASAIPSVRVADVQYNVNEMEAMIAQAEGQGVEVIVFPELSLTGYTCGDLFLQDSLLKRALEELAALVSETRELNALIFVGLPFAHAGRLYNVAAAFSGGKLLGLIPKIHIPNYGEFYEARNFVSGRELAPGTVAEIGGMRVPFSERLLFRCQEMPEVTIGVEICEDLWAPDPPSTYLALSGATVIVNPSASNEITGKDVYRRSLVANQSARLLCGYVYACAGE